jgi:hypothetical protein
MRLHAADDRAFAAVGHPPQPIASSEQWPRGIFGASFVYLERARVRQAQAVRTTERTSAATAPQLAARKAVDRIAYRLVCS